MGAGNGHFSITSIFKDSFVGALKLLAFSE